MRKILPILLLLFFFLFSCQKEQPGIRIDVSEDEFYTTPPMLKIFYNGTLNGLNYGVLYDTIYKSSNISVETDQKEWSFKTLINDKLPENEKWLFLTKQDNKLLIEAKDNYTDIDRTDTIIISVNKATSSGTISSEESKTIIQYSYDPPLESFIPDVYFREKIKSYKDYGEIDSRRDAKLWIQSIQIDERRFGAIDKYIKSLKGIEALLNLWNFNCNYSIISKMDFSANKNLKIISLYNNNTLESIDISSLEKLTVIDLDGNILLRNINLTTVPSLKNLSLSRNDISSIDLSNNKELLILKICESRITDIDLSNNLKLESLTFGGLKDYTGRVLFNSQINNVDLTKNQYLKTISFNLTKIKSIDLTYNPNVEEINCNDNIIESLVLGKNIKLKTLNCANNKLKELDLSDVPNLLYLDCTGNPIEIIFVNKNFDIDNPLPTFKKPSTAVYKYK